jgi:IS605 OrfB family transposase
LKFRATRKTLGNRSQTGKTKELDDYGLREGTIGGWAELRKRLVDVYQKGTKAGKGQSELCNDLEEAVDAEQTANRQGFGSADFFHKLCEPAYHHLWLPTGEYNGIKDFIPHYVAYSEWKEELRDLLEENPANANENDDAAIEGNESRTKPISYTWPGLLNRHGDATTTKLLVSVVEFCLPLRGRHWKWDGSRKDRLFWGDNDSEWKPKIQGMRGLSLKRLEQVLNLRQRCQSFAKLEDRFVKQFANNNWNPLPPMRRDEADDPCALLLDKSNELRYQRVDQIAHLILTEALSAELKNPAEVANKTIRKNEVDLHGEYKPRLGKNGEPLPRCSVIVLENLDRYRTSQERTRQENSRLMKWAHRAILEKLEDICAPFGITIMLVDPAFSSRFDSRNGLPGVRVNSVSKDFDKQMPYAAWVQQKDKTGKPSKLANDIVNVAKLFEENPNYKDQLIIAVEGGKEFLSVCGTEKDKLNADINAAMNIGLRAVADPGRWIFSHDFGPSKSETVKCKCSIGAAYSGALAKMTRNADLRLPAH